MRILLLAGNTLRSRAYAQQLAKRADIEVLGLFFGFQQMTCNIPNLSSETYLFLKNHQINIPDFANSLEITFNERKWDFQHVEHDDINSTAVLEAISRVKVDLIVYSGYGGQILKQDHFNDEIPYLHMHPGFLPEERGSTTIYYSILNGRKCSVSAFFMNSKIDAGGIVVRKEYEIPSIGVDIDMWYDNCIRADCLDTALDIIHKMGFQSINPDYSNTQEYYIIHPVLKHLAILSLK